MHETGSRWGIDPQHSLTNGFGPNFEGGKQKTLALSNSNVDKIDILGEFMDATRFLQCKSSPLSSILHQSPHKFWWYDFNHCLIPLISSIYQCSNTKDCEFNNASLLQMNQTMGSHFLRTRKENIEHSCYSLIKMCIFLDYRHCWWCTCWIPLLLLYLKGMIISCRTKPKVVNIAKAFLFQQLTIISIPNCHVSLLHL